jgi:hypothetical protein
MNANARDALFREYINPYFRGRGFTRQGRVYRRTNDGGDMAVVQFQASSGSTADSYRFYVNIAVIPKPWQDFLDFDAVQHSAQPRPPDGSRGMYWRRVQGSPERDIWAIDDLSSMPAVWRRLEGPLSADVSQAIALLDHEALLAYAEHGGRDVQVRPELLRAFLLVDSANAATVERVIEDLEQSPKRADEVAWLRSRFADRA